MICTLCRSNVPDDALVCPECGELATTRVELSPNQRSGTVLAVWLLFGMIAFVLLITVPAILARSSSPSQASPVCLMVLALIGVLFGPTIIRHGPGRLLKTAAGQAPRYATRDLTYLHRLRVESSSGRSGIRITYFAAFDGLQEFTITSSQHDQLKGREGQRFVVTHLPEFRELLEFAPAPPGD